MMSFCKISEQPIDYDTTKDNFVVDNVEQEFKNLFWEIFTIFWNEDSGYIHTEDIEDAFKSKKIDFDTEKFNACVSKLDFYLSEQCLAEKHYKDGSPSQNMYDKAMVLADKIMNVCGGFGNAYRWDDYPDGVDNLWEAIDCIDLRDEVAFFEAIKEACRIRIYNSDYNNLKKAKDRKLFNEFMEKLTYKDLDVLG